MNFNEMAKNLNQKTVGLSYSDTITEMSRVLREAYEQGKAEIESKLNAHDKSYLGALVRGDEFRKKHKEVVGYCAQHIDKMWASTIVGILLNCDFRDASEALKKWRGDELP